MYAPVKLCVCKTEFVIILSLKNAVNSLKNCILLLLFPFTVTHATSWIPLSFSQQIPKSCPSTSKVSLRPINNSSFLLPLPCFKPPSICSQVVPVVKNPPANAGDIRDVSSIPGLGRSPEGGHGNPLQYPCLENPMDRGAWQVTVHWVTKGQTWLKWFSMHTSVGLSASSHASLQFFAHVTVRKIFLSMHHIISLLILCLNPHFPF